MEKFVIKASEALEQILRGGWSYNNANGSTPAEWQDDLEFKVPGTNGSVVSVTVFCGAPFTAFTEELDIYSRLLCKENPAIIDMVYQVRTALEDHYVAIEGGDLGDLPSEEYNIEFEDDLAGVPGLGTMTNAEAGDILCYILGGWKRFVDGDVTVRAYKDKRGAVGYLFDHDNDGRDYYCFVEQAAPGEEPKFKDFGACNLEESYAAEAWPEANGYEEQDYGFLGEVVYSISDDLVKWGGKVEDVCRDLKLPASGGKWLTDVYNVIKQDVLDKALGTDAPAYY